MEIILNIDDKLGEKIGKKAADEGTGKNEWVAGVVSDYLSGKTGEHEINALKEEIRLQIELREAYARLLDERNNRIDDLKEEIARIEVLSVTVADQINQDKEDRIKDLNRMIEHLQGQAAAHSLALQSAITNREKEEEEENPKNHEKKLIEKPRWMFWK